jgi:asparagine synthase (glutamine-hydrolysing)
VLGQVRLALGDAAPQPVRGKDGRLALVCNGRVYNQERLRSRLLASHRLDNGSDAQLILHLYEDLGAGCVHELDGPFAFFVSDGRRFLAARDAFGVKPLYVGWNASRRDLWFASEFKALVAHCDGFRALPPGSYVTHAGEVRHWFAPGWARRPGAERKFSPNELQDRLDAALVKRLTDPARLGVFLSGGLDSSVLSALAVRRLDFLQTFAAGMEGAADLEAARGVAKLLGTRHRECVFTFDDVVTVLEDVIYHLESYDPALVRGAVPYYLLSRLAAESVKVVLVGEGADELFAGYRHLGALANPAALHAECVALLGSLHCLNLQRLDRMTMAHGLEARVPFLDPEFAAWSMRLDPRLKLHDEDGQEKRLLRRACRQLLPRTTLARRQLDIGSGSSVELALIRHAEQSVSDHDLANAALRFPLDPPTTKEQLLYRRCFEELFPGRWPRENVQRWRRPDVGAPESGIWMRRGASSLES